MKHTLTATLAMSAALFSCACSSESKTEEPVGAIEQKIGPDQIEGCTSVPLRNPGENLPGNVGASIVGEGAWSNGIGDCFKEVRVSSGSDYAGDNRCPSQAIVEASEGQGWARPAGLNPGVWPTEAMNQEQCTSTIVTMAFYGFSKAQNAWITIESRTQPGTWFGYCTFIPGAGVDANEYSKLRVAGSAYRWMTVKGSTFPVNVPVEVRLGDSCIW